MGKTQIQVKALEILGSLRPDLEIDDPEGITETQAEIRIRFEILKMSKDEFSDFIEQLHKWYEENKNLPD